MKIKRSDIGEGDEAIRRTIAEMRRLVHKDAMYPDVRATARSIKKSCESFKEDPVRYEYEVAKAAFMWVVDNVEYRYDHEAVTDYITTNAPKSKELLIAPRHLMRDIRQGDCDDMSMTLAALLLALGFRTAFKVIAHSSWSFSHVYTEIYLSKLDKWIPADPVMGYRGWANEKADIIRKEITEV